jgi:type VI protein secretion system component VasK
MKNLIWVIVAAVILGGGYMLFSGKSPQDIANDISETVDEPDTLQSAAEATGEAVETAAETTVEAVEDAADTVVEEASGATNTAADALEQTATDAAEVATGTAEEAAEAASEAVDEVADMVEESAAAVTDTAPDASGTETATQEADEAAGDMVENGAEETGGLSDALTVDGFDLDKVTEAIDASDLGQMEKMTLKNGIEQARDNPDALAQILARIRDALGLGGGAN